MHDLFQNILTASFHGSIVILAVLLLRLVLKKTPKKFFCLLWLLAGIRLLMPFEIRSDLSLQPQPEPVIQQILVQEILPVSGELLPPATKQEPVSPQVQLPAQEAPASSASEADPSPSPAPVMPELSNPQQTAIQYETRSPGWVEALPWIWLGVASLFLIYTAYSYIRMRLLVRESVKIPGGWECDRIETAFILGFIRPKIYIPMGLSKMVRRHILAHERTHLEKGDHWYKMIGFIALALHWFNPLVWIAYILLCKDIEMACDERVVQFMELQERKEYSAALLNCSTNKAHFAACPVAFGEVSVKHRIKSVLKYKKPSFWISLAGVIAIIFVAVCLVTSPEGSDSPAPTETVETTIPQGESAELVQRIQSAWDAILESEDYLLVFMDETANGSIGWQARFYKDGDTTLWWSTDHSYEDGHMVLDGKQYQYIQDADSWVSVDTENDLLPEMLSHFSLDNKKLYDMKSESVTNDAGYSYERITFTAESTIEDGGIIIQPIKVILEEDGTLSSMTIENTARPSADYFVFSNWSGDPETEVFIENAKNSILNAEDIDPDLLQAPTEDELRMQQWGIQFRVEDDILTRYGSEAWFCQSDGYDMTVHTDNSYWLEKKTEDGWEKLPMLVEDFKWPEANYVLGHGMYTMVKVDWSTLYGPLSSGTYRMGKIFEKMANGSQTCVGYAEFEIFHNDSSSADQTAAVEKCYQAVEELCLRDTIHYKVTAGTDTTEEIWYNGGDYLAKREWQWAVMPENDDGQYPGPEDITYVTRHSISARKDGIGYACVFEDPEEPASEILGMELRNLSADFAGWELYEFSNSLHLSFFERGNQVIDFSSQDCCITENKIRFHQYWDSPDSYSAMTFWFADGKITKMEYESHYEPDWNYTTTYEIFDTPAAEIDALIQPYTENLLVDSFSWAQAKAEFTDDKYNIKDSGFHNNDLTTISGPVEAAKRALREYPHLESYLNILTAYDEEAHMWRVTFEGYYDYQATYEYRDVYLDDNGITHLMVYEGPVEERE